MDLGWSGFTPVGYPKVVRRRWPIMSKRTTCRKMRSIFIGASIGAEIEDRWASLKMTDKRWPYQTGKVVQKQVNDGTVRMGDKHFPHAQDLAYGFYTMQRGGGFDLGLIGGERHRRRRQHHPAGSVGVAPEVIQNSTN
jgi:acetyl-CoA hydrolase